MKKNRREFLKTTGLASLGLPALLSSCTQAKGKSRPQAAIITNTVRDYMREDYRKTLEALAEMGYRNIEGGTYDNPAAEFATTMNQLGLDHIAYGGALAGMQNDTADYLRTAETLGVEYLVCYWPWLDGADNLDEARFFLAAEHLNALGKQASAAGLKLVVHNHAMEYQQFGDKTGMDIIIENTDPADVNVELDLYWVAYAGHDPVDTIVKHPGRIKLFHVKDMDNTPERERTCVGAGVIDFAPIFALSETAGVEYYIIEQEVAPPEVQMDCARMGYDALKAYI